MDNRIDTGCGSRSAVESVDRHLPQDTLTTTITRPTSRWLSSLGQGLIIGFVAVAPLLAGIVFPYECVVDGRTVTRGMSPGGFHAHVADHPWQVALFEGESFACGGVLLRAEWVLTQGQCVADIHPSDLKVGYGVGDPLNIGSPEWYAARDVFVHPEYDPAATAKNDIALLRLADPVAHALALTVPVNLPLQGETRALERPDTCAVLSGYWARRSELSATDSLQLRAFSGSVCSTGTENGAICVSGLFKNQCIRGGAVTVGGLPNRPLWLVGIVTPEKGCAEDEGSDSVTRVAHYREWIESTMARPPRAEVEKQTGGAGVEFAAGEPTSGDRTLPLESDILISFATEAGSVASDGRPGGLSPYATALVGQFGGPELRLTDLLINVTAAVHESTGGQQVPSFRGSLSAPFYFVPVDSRAGERVALVIGNAGYESFPLNNPVRDAESVAKELQAAGFTVTVRRDLTQSAFHGALEEFRNASARAATAVFYYSGHGFEEEGVNYLVPVDFKSDAPRELLVVLDEVIASMQAKRRLLFLDTDRNVFPPRK